MGACCATSEPKFNTGALIRIQLAVKRWLARREKENRRLRMVLEIASKFLKLLFVEERLF